MTEVIFGNNVTSIGDAAFRKCSSLTSVTSLNLIPPKVGWSVFEIERATIEETAILHVLEGCGEVYQQHSYWGRFLNIQADVPTDIEDVHADVPSKVDAIYTFEGVKCNTANLSDLPKGIYIVNGKKVMVK